MSDVKVRPISSAPLRLPPGILRQAEGLARSAGVTVPELVEALLLGLLEAEAGQPVPPPPAPRIPAPRRDRHGKKGGRVLVMDDFRRRELPPTGPPDEAGECLPIRDRAARVRRHAVQVRARSARVCEEARRARDQARAALEELSRLEVGPARHGSRGSSGLNGISVIM